MIDTNIKFIYLDPIQNSELHCNFIYLIWEKMVEQKLEKLVFYDGSITTRNQFREHVFRVGSVPIIVLYKNSIAAFSWLNNFEGKTARGHFMCLKNFWGNGLPVKLGNAIYNYFLNMKDEHGYVFDTLIGIMPAHNKLSIRTSIKAGAVFMGNIPSMCVLHDGTVQDGAMITITRKSLKESCYGK